MDLIIETDIGHDPDDVFAICYLHSVGVNIRAIVVAAGKKVQDKDEAPYMVALVKFLCKELGLDIPVGHFPNEAKLPIVEANRQHYGAFHIDLLEQYGHPLKAESDGTGQEVLTQAFKDYPNAELFICGPMLNTGRFLMQDEVTEITRATVQGGFLPYSVYSPSVRLKKFEGKNSFRTWNLDGSVQDAQTVIHAPNIKQRRFVSKNVCHTIIYDKEIHELVKDAPANNRADEIFRDGMELYLQKKSSKAFHDPAAAVCHLHPEIATWVKGDLLYDISEGKWTTRANEAGDDIIGDVDRDTLWQHLIFKEKYEESA